MTKSEFDVRRGFVDLNSNLKVWCETKEQEQNVLEYLNSQGYRWHSRDSLLELSYSAPLGLHIWSERKDVTYSSDIDGFCEEVGLEVSYDAFIKRWIII